MPPKKQIIPNPIDRRAREAIHAIRDAANEAVLVLGVAAKQAAATVLEAASNGPKQQLSTAARDAATAISVAAKDAAQTLAGAAKDANTVLVQRADTGEDWNENRKLVLSELQRLNRSLEDGLAKVFVTFKTHSDADDVLFRDINTKLMDASDAHVGLKVDVAALTERVDHQLWSVYGTMLASLVAILFTLGFHFIK
jgi:hypothetical protein